MATGDVIDGDVAMATGDSVEVTSPWQTSDVTTGGDITMATGDTVGVTSATSPWKLVTSQG